MVQLHSDAAEPCDHDPGAGRGDHVGQRRDHRHMAGTSWRAAELVLLRLASVHVNDPQRGRTRFRHGNELTLKLTHTITHTHTLQVTPPNPRLPFVMFEVGTALGQLLALTSPGLSEASRHPVYDSLAVDILLSSPDQKWILTASKDNSDSSPKVRVHTQDAAK